MDSLIRQLTAHRAALTGQPPGGAHRPGGWRLVRAWLLDISLTLLRVPRVLRRSSVEDFQSTARRTDRGAYLDSYSHYLRYYRASVGCFVLAATLIALKIASVILIGVFTLGEPREAEAATISVAGTVYLTNESTTATSGNGGACDGATANLSLRVNGGVASTTTCSGSDATYTFSSVTVNAGETITIYSTDELIVANRVYVSDATADSGMDLYQNTVVIGDEQDGDFSILDLLDYDNDQDAVNMLFDADDLATDTLTVETNHELHIFGGDTFTPGGDVTVNTDLHVPASSILSIGSGFQTTLARTSGTALTLSGTISGVGTLVYSTLTAFPTSGTISSILRADATGASSVSLPARTYGGDVVAYNNSGTNRDVFLGTAGQTTTISGHFQQNSNSTAAVRARPTGTVNIAGDWDYVGVGSGAESVLYSTNGTMAVSGNVDLSGGTAPTGTAPYTLTMNGSGKTLTGTSGWNNINLSGSITISGSLSLSGNLDLTGGTITAGTSTISLTGTGNLIGSGQTLNNLTIDGSGNTVTVTTSDLSVSGTLTLGGSGDGNNDTLDLASGRSITVTSTGTLTIPGSGTDTISGSGTLIYQPTAAFPTTGTVSSVLRFDATSNNQTISARTYGGAVEVYSNSGSEARTVTLGTAGSQTLTFSSNLTVNAANSQNVTLSGTNDPTVDLTGNLDFTGSGSGTERITTGAGAWTVLGNVDFSDGTPTITAGNTFYLNGSGGLQEIIPKGHAGVTFSTLRIGANEDVAMWNSTATTFTIDGGGCLLSQDHGGTDGRLNIYGACNSRSNEYWSYATDFDGTALGTPRQADVRLASGASLTVDSGETLAVLGQSAAANRTQITRQSTGNFGLTINGTINAQYYDVDYTDASGLNLASTATVTNLADGSFDNIASGASASYITVTGVSSTATFSNLLFDSATDGTDANAIYNINADGAGIVWTLSGSSGNRFGEDYDREVSGASVTWVTAAVSVNDGSGTDSDLTNSTTSLPANWTVSNPSGIASYSYAIGTTSGGTQVSGFTSTGATTNVTRTGLSLTHGTTYYVTVRVFNGSNELVATGASDGIAVDAVAPTFSSIATTSTTTSLTITWTTSEAATTKVKYGLTTGYGSETTEDASRVTAHSASITGLTAGTTYHFQPLGTDQAGNTGTSSDQNAATSSLAATVITNTQATVLGPTSVKITWTTNHPADSKVRYGKTTAFGLEKYDATLVTSHEITLTDLEPGTTYSYEVLSVGNTSTNDATATFTTTVGEPVTEAPTETLPAPTILTPTGDQAFLKGETIRLIGLAGSGYGVRVYVDGALTGQTSAQRTTTGTGSFDFTIQTALTVGSHSLQVQAITDDAVSPLGPARTIVVQHPSIAPTIEPLIVSDGDQPTFTVRGLGPTGSTIRVLVDGKVVATRRLSGIGARPFAITLSTKIFSDGRHTIEVVAYDAAGRPSQSKEAARFTLKDDKPVVLRSAKGVRHVVKDGESLWQLADRFYGDSRQYPKLVRANEKRFPSLTSNPSLIVPGWRLHVPP